MWQPQVPLERDGSPVREFAFWLRDLRNRSGLTYEQVARSTHYGTSTLQAATSGERLPTLKVVMAFVKACDGDQTAWRTYWTQLRRMLDPDAPHNAAWSVAPPWSVAPSWAAEPRSALAGQVAAAPAKVTEAAGSAQARIADDEGWYVESFKALLRLDAEPIEAIEQRVIVATKDGIGELSTSICVPRHQDDSGAGHQ